MTPQYVTTAGIDYGHGRTNLDIRTGIRYGCIGTSTIAQAWSDCAEPEYGDPTCPRCGGSVDKLHGPTNEYECTHCAITLDDSDAYPDQAIGWYVNDREYEAHDCLDADVMVTRSPYYTHAAFCSPWVPGAGDLNAPMADGVRTYCFGHDWFDTGAAPYPVYAVATGKLILPTP